MSIGKKWKNAFWAVVLLWFGIGLTPMLLFGSWEVRGQVGDMFGAVNSLFSGLAFAGVILAIFLQREELALQREELKMTREELKRSAEAQEESSQALKQQVAALRATAQLTAINQQLASLDAQTARMGDSTKAFKRVMSSGVRERLLGHQAEILQRLGVEGHQGGEE
jgi:hypothetical protein